MAESGFGGPQQVSGHMGRIPHFGKNQMDPRAVPEPPACIQNAMMTKDKKPFTYTPGGLDLSQIKTPSMARRLARQRSQEEQEQMYTNQPIPNGGPYQPSMGGPPPPPPMAPAPPPPPPLVIKAPNDNSQKPIPIGERPEIVIPENPIGMLRKTHSPYHWESEQADRERMGAVPKFVEKAPSPINRQAPPSSFSQQPPQSYATNANNNMPRQTYPQGAGFNKSPESPIHKPEPQYPTKSQYQQHQPTSPPINTQTRDLLQRQDSQFNKSPTPFGPQGLNCTGSTVTNSSPISPSPNSNWKQPERRESPIINNNAASPQFTRTPFSPTNGNRSNTPQNSPYNSAQSPPSHQNESPVYHTLPRTTARGQENFANNNSRPNPIDNNYNNTIYNNVRNDFRSESPKVTQANPAPWRSNTLNNSQKDNDNNNYIHQANNQNNVSPSYNCKPNENQQNITNPWKAGQHPHQQSTPASPPSKNNTLPAEVRYQSTMSIPVTPRNSKPAEPEQRQQNKDVIYVTQEPVYYHQPDSPKSVPGFVRPLKEKTPPPEWCQRALDGRKSLPRDVVSPQRDRQIEPEWVQRSNEMRKSVPRELVSPPRTQHSPPQAAWSTRPSENRKSVPRDTPPTFAHSNVGNSEMGARVVPIQMERTSTDVRNQQRQPGNQQQPLRIIIDMQQNPQSQAQPPYSQPTQRIMRVLSPQLVRLDQDGPSHKDLPTLSNNQPKTRIIPIQVESGGNNASNRSFGGRN